MLDNELIDEIKSSYENSDKLKNILNDITNDANHIYWADKFSTDEYNNNTDLSAEIFEYAQEKAQTYFEFKELAFALGNSNGFNDKDWSKEVLNIAIKKVTRIRELIVIADDISRKNLKYYDKDLARSLYIEAIDKSTTSYEFYEIAESLCNIDLLNDSLWAKEIYEKAIEVCESADELTYIADSIASDLKDEPWSEELYEAAQEFGSKENNSFNED